MNFPDQGIYAITDGQLEDMELLVRSDAALRGGISMLQYRDKVRSPEEQLHMARELRTRCHAAGVPFIVNDNIDLAEAVGADGVHLGAEDDSIAVARERLGDKRIIGASCYNNLGRAKAAVEEGCNYVAFGAMFASPTKPDAPRADISLITEADKTLDIPIVAIGGIDIKNAPALIRAGADFVATITGIYAAEDSEAAARAFAELFQPTS